MGPESRVSSPSRSPTARSRIARPIGASPTTAFARAELLLIGVIWVVLTVGFEFVVGYLEGTPVSTTIAQYDVLSGQVWILVPITLFLAPLVFGWYLGR